MEITSDNGKASLIQSQYGRRLIVWERSTLEAVLTQLRQERRDIRSQSLIDQAEEIRRKTENQIKQRAAPS
jgi:hypothetical protein